MHSRHNTLVLSKEIQLPTLLCLKAMNKPNCNISVYSLRNNKTGSRQFTRAVWSTFAEIHSTHPGALMHYLGLEFHFKVKSRVQRAIQIPVRQSRVQSMFTQVTERPWEIDIRNLPIFILRHQKRLVFLLRLALFRLVGLSKRKIIEPSLTTFTGFPFALVFICTFSECV